MRLSPLDSLMQRLDAEGSEERREVQQQVLAMLPKLEQSKAADLVTRLVQVEGAPV